MKGGEIPTCGVFHRTFPVLPLILPHADSSLGGGARRITPFSGDVPTPTPNELAESGNASCYEVGCQGKRGRGKKGKKGKRKEGGPRHARGSDLPIVCADRVLKSSVRPCVPLPSSHLFKHKQLVSQVTHTQALGA